MFCIGCYYSVSSGRSRFAFGSLDGEVLLPLSPLVTLRSSSD